ncbi:MAG TPA: tetratricopeptide repeat protein, partial [Candidatus Rifleibacterium sp.]|nr:tetratricopeptide repeat protein [Candidatus Rifleibacterium sp.]
FFSAITAATLNSGFLSSLRSSMYLVTLLLLTAFLRMVRRQQDNLAIAGMISLSGATMAIYSILQAAGIDILAWNSDYQMVGTFSNPNFLAAFLMVTAMVNIGMLNEPGLKPADRAVFSLFLAVQVFAVVFSGRAGAILSIAVAAGFYFTSFWEIRPGRLMRRSAFLAGLTLAIVLTIFYGMAYYATTSYPWESMSKMPYRYMPAVTRLVLWQMGFAIFLDHPVTGLGPGAISYLMPAQRPPQGSLIGIKSFNDDPHSATISILAETGFIGLWGACTIFAVIFGCYVWRRSKGVNLKLAEEQVSTASTPENASADIDTPKVQITVTDTPVAAAAPQPDASEPYQNEPPATIQTINVSEAVAVAMPAGSPTDIPPTDGLKAVEEKVADQSVALSETPVFFPWNYSAIALLISFLAFRAGFFEAPVFFYSLPFIIAGFGVLSAICSPDQNYNHNGLALSRGSMVAIITFFFYSLFNNSISIVPLSGFMVLIVSLHFSCCLRDLVWKRKFSPAAVVFLVFPPLFVFCAYNFQIAHHLEQINLWKGQNLLAASPIDAQAAFSTAIRANPQSLKAYYGLAISLEKQNRPEETKEVLKKLDAMVPNAFNSNYELARIMLARKQVLEAHRHALKNLEWDRAPRSFELLGQILVVEGKSGEAEKVFNEGLSLFPANMIEKEASDRIRLNLAGLAASRGDFARCEELLLQIRSEVKNDMNSLYLSGMLLARKNQNEKALELFEKALEMFPQNPRFMNAIGYILCEMNTEMDRARELLEGAYQIIRKSEPVDLGELLMISHSLGKLYWKQGRNREAGELLKIAWQQCPEEWPVLKEERRRDYAEFCVKTGQEFE